jgi:hypothetical protein
MDGETIMRAIRPAIAASAAFAGSGTITIDAVMKGRACRAKREGNRFELDESYHRKLIRRSGKISPRETPLSGVSGSFQHEFPPYSLPILRIKM